MRIEEVLHRVVVRWRRNHHEVSILISSLRIQRSSQVQRFLRQILLNIIVLDGRDSLVNLIHLLGQHIHRYHFMMLSQQCSNTHAHVACSGHGYL